MAQVPPKKKKDDEDTSDKAVSRQSKLPSYTTAGQEQAKSVAAEEAANKAKDTEKLAPWLLHTPKSTLGLGDTAAVARMQREEGLSKADAEKKLKWQKDMKNKGVTAGQASRGAR